MLRVAQKSFGCLQAAGDAQIQRLVGLNRTLSSVAIKPPSETIKVASAIIPKVTRVPAFSHVYSMFLFCPNAVHVDGWSKIKYRPAPSLPPSR
ncbi:hypothetical protein EON65_31350 [archaeon]|nr:MAG: hypothetical protein EON65_31350 [archaeon]